MDFVQTDLVMQDISEPGDAVRAPFPLPPLSLPRLPCARGVPNLVPITYRHALAGGHRWSSSAPRKG